MKYLIIFNFTVNILLIGWLLHKHFLSSFYISLDKTFWCKKVYAITLMRRIDSCYSVGVVTLKLRNCKKLQDWDSEMFRTGKYKKYNKVKK